jgi:hypothetical protein
MSAISSSSCPIQPSIFFGHACRQLAAMHRPFPRSPAAGAEISLYSRISPCIPRLGSPSILSYVRFYGAQQRKRKDLRFFSAYVDVRLDVVVLGFQLNAASEYACLTIQEAMQP